MGSIIGIVESVEAAIAAGKDVAPIILKLAATFAPGYSKTREEVLAELAEMKTLEASNTAEINKPRPQEQP